MEQVLNSVEHKAAKNLTAADARTNPVSVGEFKLLLKTIGVKTFESPAIDRLSINSARIASVVPTAELADLSQLIWLANLRVSWELRKSFQEEVMDPVEAEGLRRTIDGLRRGTVDPSARHTWIRGAFEALGMCTYEEDFPLGSLFRGCEEKSYAYTTPEGVTLQYTSQMRGCDRREKTVSVGDTVLWDGSYNF